ncbi:MAG: LysO family transporter, partial [Proteobacteria bacterium]|nr:LysO family transporter [Pseudomonadota bacterium]
ASAIYMLLFFLGMSIGINEKVMNHIFTFGLKSLVLSLGAILGSVLFSYGVYLAFFREIQ